ncbi:hypothetical protein FHS55_003511 [Angulomicrobium tetraedrale]|uniref:Outer membrane beta-barrel protein n=1 Tax=Ancylobacter tetraedralis TaxID=217068 RepID=A0A839ZDZ9_9HYPH|nr:outer membrane beta-barrel protein [Ancylobacter tetraedralis]MBB3772886.1 hypothetical protein [Ancylobacter tetraedralis]
MKRVLAAGAVSGLLGSVFGGLAFASDLPPLQQKGPFDPAKVGVLDRPKTSTGIELGSFMLYPTLFGSVGYNDNITASGSAPKGDTIFIIRPAAKLESNWSRHYLSIDSYFENGSYANYSTGDWNNYSVGGNGRIDVSSDLELFGYARYSHLNELPGDDETNNGLTSPLPYDQTTAGAGLRKEFNRFWTRLMFDYRDRSYSSWLDGAPSDQTYRDGQDYTVSGRVGYFISPLTSAFVEGKYRWSFMENTDYDAEQYWITTGLQFEPSRLTRGEVYVGYTDWTTDGTLDSVPHFTYGANINWFASPLLTMTFTALQDVLTSNYSVGTVDGSSILSSTFGVRGDYEFRRNLLMSAWFSYNNQDYQNLPRNDDQYTVGGELRYLINRHATARLTYNYQDFTSNYNGIAGVENYTQNIVSAGISLAY